MKDSISKYVMLTLLCFIFFGCSANINYKLAINILDSSGNRIENGTGSFEYTSILINTTQTETFTVLNTGSGNLKLTGSPKVEISGSGASGFTVTEQPKTVIKPNLQTTFTIEFAPTIAQYYEATVTIISNDKDMSPFTFTIKGTGLAPGINVKQNTNYIPNGTGSYDFSNVRVPDSSEEVTFTIENLGTFDLNLTETPKIGISGADAAMFNINQTAISTPIAPQDSTTFTITFSPASIGLKSATISIASDDQDHNPYTFTIVGTGISPEINIKQDTDNISSGSGNYDFGNVLVTDSSPEVEFTIENLGTADLHLTDSPKVKISGSDASMFTIEQTSTTAVIEQGKTTLFNITFSPASIGSKSATISITNDDLDENPYTFTLN